MSVAFLVTTLVVVATPGAGALFTIGAGLGRGRRASLVAAVGCTIGIVPHLVAAVTGLAALLNASALAFQAVKYAGVAYLLFLVGMALLVSMVLVITYYDILNPVTVDFSLR